MPKIILVAYAAGICTVLVNVPVQIAGLCTASAVLFFLWSLCRHSAWSWGPLLCILIITGHLNAHHQLAPPNQQTRLSAFADRGSFTIEAIVDSIEQRDDGSYKVVARAIGIHRDASTHMTSGKVLLFIKEGDLNVRAGQVIRWRSRLRKPFRHGNPGEFDYPLYLASRNIYVTTHIAHADHIVAFANHPERETQVFENLRLRLSAEIRQSVPASQAALVEALLLGLRGSITSEQRHLLASSGIAHLFVISGLHFGLLALLFYQIGKSLYTRSQTLMLWRPPQRIVPLLVLLPIFFYLLLTGSSWATMRAFLMIASVAFLLCSNRKVTPINILALVALMLLLVNPLALFQPGFQLSFSGVLGILLWLPYWQKITLKIPRPLTWVAVLFMTNLAATIATAPAVLWHFHTFPPAALMVNLVAVPLTAWLAVPVGLFSLMILPISPDLAHGALLAVGFIVSCTLDIAGTISSQPLLKSLPVFLTLAEFILLLGAISLLIPLKNIRRPHRFRAGILFFTLVMAYTVRPDNSGLRVTALSVGQGDASLISIDEARNYLVDGGGMPGSRIDPGEAMVAPALGRMGADKLDGIVATHSHPDHCSGLVYIINNIPVKTFFYAGDIRNYPAELLDALRTQKVATARLDQGWTDIFSSKDATLQLFVPDQSARDINDRSIIVYVGNPQTGALLTSDAGHAVFKQLKMAPPPGPVSLFKIPHHGSKNSAPEQFLEWLKPQHSFVSAGRNNVYGFPHPETLKACRTYQTRVMQTDRDGMLTFALDDKQWFITSYYSGRSNDQAVAKKLYN